MQTQASRALVAALVLATFLIVNAIGLIPFRLVAADLTGWPRMLALAVFGYGLYLAGPLAVAAGLFGRRRMFATLGLAHPPWRALAFAAACCSVVVAWSALTTTPSASANVAIDIVRGALLPGAAEEILFRAFLFGFLYRFAGWGFLPAACLSSLVFGLEHVYQGGDAAEAIGIAVLTGVAGLWFSWLLAEWRWNAWVPIAFHVLLNANFEAFAVADNALGSGDFVLTRAACILLSVLATLMLARRRGGRQVRGARWWRGSGAAQALERGGSEGVFEPVFDQAARHADGRR